MCSRRGRRCMRRTMATMATMATMPTMATVHRARVQHPRVAKHHGEPEREQRVQRSGQAGKATHERA